MKVSILMCVYNGETTISESIESILKQSYQDFELIIVDDGSIDGTSRILDTYKKNDDRITVLPKKNEGLTRSLNYGLSFCNGEYIARQDADDISDYRRIEKLINFISINQVDFLSSRFERFNSNSSIDIRPKRWLLNKSFSLDILEFGNLHAHGSFFFRRSIYDNGIRYDEKFKTAQDFDFLLNVLTSGYKCMICRDVLYRLRVSDVSISAVNREGQSLNAENILKKYGLISRLSLGKPVFNKIYMNLLKFVQASKR